MIHSPASRTRRAGFTLVEVLVVIAIIVVLVALTASAVFKVAGKGDELVARKDISDIAQAVESFKTYFHVDFVPSRIRLRELGDYQINQGIQIEDDSYAFLKKLWPKLSFNTSAPPGPSGVVLPPGIDWNANGQIDPGPIDLEGHQCIVFFLGGIQQSGQTIPSGPASCLGFNTNPAHPEAPVGAQNSNERIPPFLQFKGDRLVYVPDPNTGTLPAFFSYQDAFSKTVTNPKTGLITPVVYAYFSAYKKPNGYNRYYNVTSNPLSDCPSLLAEDPTNPGKNPPVLIAGVWPYAQALTPTVQYLNPNSYQIICAGPNGVFGVGTNPLLSQPMTWTPSNTGTVTPAGKDDFSNFHDRPLGSGD